MNRLSTIIEGYRTGSRYIGMFNDFAKWQSHRQFDQHWNKLLLMRTLERNQISFEIRFAYDKHNQRQPQYDTISIDKEIRFPKGTIIKN